MDIDNQDELQKSRAPLLRDQHKRPRRPRSRSRPRSMNPMRTVATGESSYSEQKTDLAMKMCQGDPMKQMATCATSALQATEDVTKVMFFSERKILFLDFKMSFLRFGSAKPSVMARRILSIQRIRCLFDSKAVVKWRLNSFRHARSGFPTTTLSCSSQLSAFLLFFRKLQTLSRKTEREILLSW